MTTSTSDKEQKKEGAAISSQATSPLSQSPATAVQLMADTATTRSIGDSTRDDSKGETKRAEIKEEKSTEDGEPISATPGYLTQIILEKDFKRLKAGVFKWDKIPRLAVITGKNGIGKTNVLDLIEDSLMRLAIGETASANLAGAKGAELPDVYFFPSGGKQQKDEYRPAKLSVKVKYQVNRYFSHVGKQPITLMSTSSESDAKLYRFQADQQESAKIGYLWLYEELSG